MKPKLKELLQTRITYSDLAREYGCTRAFVTDIAAGRCKAPARFKIMCAKRLGLPVTVIFPDEEKQ